MADCCKNVCVMTKDESKPSLRSPFRTLASLDSDRVFKATGKIFLAILASLVLIWSFALDGLFSEASTFTLQAGSVQVAGLNQVITCMFTGSLTAGVFSCVNTQQGTPSGGSTPGTSNVFPDQIVSIDLPLTFPLSPFQGSSYWSMWLTAGCFPTFAASSDRCRAVSYLLGYQIFTTVVLSAAIVVLLIGLMFTAEALFQMVRAEDEKDIVGLRVLELWKWMTAAVALTGFSFFTWPIVLLSAITVIRDFYATGLISAAGDFGSFQTISSRTALVRPGAAYFYVIAVFCLCVYALVTSVLLERAFGPRFVPPPQSQYNQGQQQPYHQQSSFTGAAAGPSDGSIPGWPPKPPPQETMQQQQQYAASSYDQQQQAMYQQQQQAAYPPPPPGPPPLPPGFVPPPPPPEVN